MKYLIPLVILLTVGIASGAEINFHVSLAGNPNLHPGEETSLVLLIENEGKVSNFPLNENTSELLQLVTTAKDLRVELEDEWIPIKVKSYNPQVIGDLPSGRVARVVFRVKVDDNAELGEYRIPVRLEYTKVAYTGNVISYEDEVDVEYLKVEITKKDYDFGVLKVESNLRAGCEGIVAVTVENVGNERMCNATLILNATPPLIPNPNATVMYLGNLKPGDTSRAEFKVYVMKNALNQTYPVTLVLRFETAGGMPIVLRKVVGVKVFKEDSFVVKGVSCILNPPKTVKEKTYPSRGFVSIKVENVGKDVKDVVAFLKFDDPTIRAENTPYIEEFKRGSEVSLKFYVLSYATVGRYHGTLLLKYKNEMGDYEVNDMDIGVDVKPTPPIVVEGVKCRNLAVGLKGDVEVTVRNTLNETLRDIEFVVISDGTVVPLSPTYYLDEIGPEGVKNVKFRLMVSREAVSGLHEVYIVERYDLEGFEDLTSVTEFPVFVKPKKAHFEVLSVESNLHPDETGDVVVKIKNSGNFDVRNAVVELTVSPPLSIAGVSSLSGLIGKPQPGLYFLGTLKRNESKVARFRVDVDKDAGVGFYPATLIIKYEDEEGYTYFSNPITISLEVKEKSIFNPITVTAGVLIGIAVVVGLRFARKRR